MTIKDDWTRRSLLDLGPACPNCGARMQDQAISPFVICPRCGLKLEKERKSEEY